MYVCIYGWMDGWMPLVTPLTRSPLEDEVAVTVLEESITVTDTPDDALPVPDP